MEPALRPEYVKSGLRNLRCFPTCTDGGVHRASTFCGESIKVQIDGQYHQHCRLIGGIRSAAAMAAAASCTLRQGDVLFVERDRNELAAALPLTAKFITACPQETRFCFNPQRRWPCADARGGSANSVAAHFQMVLLREVAGTTTTTTFWVVERVMVSSEFRIVTPPAKDGDEDSAPAGTSSSTPTPTLLAATSPTPTLPVPSPPPIAAAAPPSPVPPPPPVVLLRQQPLPPPPPPQPSSLFPPPARHHQQQQQHRPPLESLAPLPVLQGHRQQYSPAPAAPPLFHYGLVVAPPTLMRPASARLSSSMLPVPPPPPPPPPPYFLSPFQVDVEALRAASPRSPPPNNNNHRNHQ